MAHAYTPGLRVSDAAVVVRERRLPLRGDVLVARGDRVAPDTVVARTDLPGNVQTVNLSGQLGLEPARVAAALLQPVGARVARGAPIASSRGLFGLVRTVVAAPADGVIESVSAVTGQLVLREPPIPVEMTAYVSGTVVELLPGEGVRIEARGAILQGIFGVGGETFGAIEPVGSGPGDELRREHLRPEHRGKVLVGGAYVGIEALLAAREAGAVAVVVGGFDDRDLRELLGRDLGVAITGGENIGLTLVLTEGFGRIPMALRTWELLGSHRGRAASVSGATQIRAGVQRPEILIPHEGVSGASASDAGGGLEPGVQVRVIREPWFGRIGRVAELPTDLRELETEARVRVLVVEFADGGERALVPRANVERISA
ncbi:MAG TPA: hypothetical protein VMH61_06960 [Candidatus Acidoferrales bacterium]|nr:hypothetical protein [Candidatus Acidoferrales bacterium]